MIPRKVIPQVQLGGRNTHASLDGFQPLALVHDAARVFPRRVIRKQSIFLASQGEDRIVGYGLQ